MASQFESRPDSGKVAEVGAKQDHIADTGASAESDEAGRGVHVGLFEERVGRGLGRGAVIGSDGKDGRVVILQESDECDVGHSVEVSQFDPHHRREQPRGGGRR